MTKNGYYLNRDFKYTQELEDLSTANTQLSIDEEYRNLNRVRVNFFILGLVFLIFIGRMISLQIFMGNEFLERSEGNRLLARKIPALRGKILDSDRRPLASIVPSYSLYYFGLDMLRLNDMARQIGIDVSRAAQSAAWEKRDYSGIVVLRNLDSKEAMLLSLKIAKFYPDLVLVSEPRRNYIYQDIGLGGVLGFLGKQSQEEWVHLDKSVYSGDDEIGKSGLEKYYEGVLKGRNGRLEIEVDSYGRQKEESRKIESVAGSDIVLTIDIEMQAKLAKFLSEEIKLNGKTAGAAIVQDPLSGSILAMVSYPDFDNNVFLNQREPGSIEKILSGASHPLFFRPVQGLYPSGSTIKPIVASAALEERKIDSNFKVLSTGGIQIGKSFFPDWKPGGHGITNVVKALSDSVNTFFYVIGGGYGDFEGLGEEKIKEYALRFGWGRRLGIDMDGEEDGFLPSRQWKEEVKKEKWYLGDTYHLAIGQGDVLVTPLQVTAMMSTIANGGALFRPHLLKYSLNSRSQEVDNLIKPEIIYKDIISSSTLAIIRQGLRRAVLSGSSRRLQSLPVSIAGKTGTAQVSNGEPHAWFTGFAPFENPKIVLTVLIEHGEEGSKTAVPVAYKFLKWYFETHTLNP